MLNIKIKIIIKIKTNLSLFLKPTILDEDDHTEDKKKNNNLVRLFFCNYKNKPVIE